MKRYTLSAEHGISRGAPFELVFRSADEETAFADADWRLDLGHRIGDPDVVSTTVDPSERAGTPPLLRFSLTADQTADIAHNLVIGDVEADGVPQARFVIPVSGDYTENPAE